MSAEEEPAAAGDFSIYFHTEGVDFALGQDENHLRDWIRRCAEEEEGSQIGDLNFVFCSDTYLHELNLEHLDHDTYTDIITFDYSEPDSISGDIFISVDRVRENAREFHTELKDELNRVMIHGVLHLIGYKDKTSEESQAMRAKEDFCLSLRAF